MAGKGAPKNLAAWRVQAIRTIEASRRKTLEFLKKIPSAEILQPHTMGQWSIKDVVAHIVAWEGEAVKRFRQILRGEGQRILFYDNMVAADRFNARAVKRARRLPYRALLREAVRVRRELIGILRRLPASELNNPTHRYPVIGWLPEFAWHHEQDHLRRIRAWWSSRRRELVGEKRRVR